MNNCIFAFPDRTIPTTQGPTALSGGSWNTSFPLTNLQDATDKRMSSLARTSDALATSSIIKGNFTIDRDIRVFVLCRHNLTSAATVRLQLYSDAAWTNQVYDSTALNAWPTYFPPDALLWGHLSGASGVIPAEDVKGFKFDFLHVIPSQTTCKSYKVSIIDTANADGYIELSRCILAPGWQPNKNMAFGPGVQWVDPSESSKSVGGVKWFNKKTKYRQITGGVIDSLTTESGMGAWFEMQRRLGNTEELYFVFDPTDTYGAMMLRSFLGTFQELSPLEFALFDNCTGNFSIEELL